MFILFLDEYLVEIPTQSDADFYLLALLSSLDRSIILRSVEKWPTWQLSNSWPQVYVMCSVRKKSISYSCEPDP